MNTHGEYVDERVVGGGRPARRTRFGLLATGAAALVAVLLGTAAAPAFAATTDDSSARPSPSASAPSLSATAPPLSAPTGTPTGSPQNHLTPSPGAPTSPPAQTPVRPTIADPGDITSGTVRFSGTGTPGHAVRVTGPATTGSAGCSATVAASGTWSCFAALASGPQQVFAVGDRTAPELGTARTPASDVIVPPTVTTVRPTSGPVSGTGHAGSTVTLSVAGSSTDRTAVVGPDGRWTVSLVGATPGSAGATRLSVTATQTASTADGYRSDLRSASSAPVPITLDRSAPAAPRITSPAAGERVRTQPTMVAGTGEARAVLTVYVDRSPVCRVDVPASGRWACATTGTTLAPGSRTISATQQDAAGNFSRSSADVVIDVARSSGTPTGTAGTGGTGTPTGSAGSGSGTPGAGTVPGSTGGHGSASAGSSGSDAGAGSTGTGGPGSTGAGAGGAGAGGTGRPHGLDWSGPAGDWTASTAYDSTVPTIQAASSWNTVLVATAVAAGFLVLIAGPLALVGAAARGRLRNPFSAVLGRNRPHAERRRGDDLLPTWASATTAVLIVGLCTVLGVGVSLEARYVRLAIAVLLGAAVLATTVVLSSRWAAGTQRGAIGFRVSPWLVLAALVACGVTRTFDLSPALIVGTVLLPVGRPGSEPVARQAAAAVAAGPRSATWRSIALLVVAAVGWVLHSVTPSSGFWGSIVSEFAITLCVGGLGAVVATMLPLAGSAGQSLLEESRARYAAVTALAVALAAAVYSGTAGTHASPVSLLVVAAGCTAAAVASRFWLRTDRTA